MKKIILLVSLLMSFSLVEAQLLKKLKEKVDKKVDKTVDDAAGGKKDEKKNAEAKDTTTTPSVGGSQPASFKTYSKYDFVPGEKVIAF